ncbi:Glutamine synthetase [Poriferisphaera corsica]|uniref:Glutamine synthetase n=1 Tax=Poriferisphaera corsica TaxID=2528020 RepID=A0A517YWN4_9BACT|nr:type I glutamate--ammonia ligase [Poriferisphaera corsica]QDU34641.1 Glutamine synthetase [Poriferisphaera corsica]
MTPIQVLHLIKTKKIEYVDCRFMDFPGLWQHVMYPAKDLVQESFVEGFGFDGSAVRGWEAINEEDKIIVPVSDTAQIDPFMKAKTLAMICDVKDPVTKKRFSRDPRSVARKAEAYLRDSEVADEARFGPELEFFVFDRVRFDQGINYGIYEVDSVEGIWNRGKDDDGNKGYQVRQREGYFPCAPIDTLIDMRCEMVSMLSEAGIKVMEHHHEVATGGQAEIDLGAMGLTDMADAIMFAKHYIKNIAAKHGKTATFMPKPLFGDNGSGMHTHLSLWKGGENLMNGHHYGGLSKLGVWAIGGILKHTNSLCAFTNPTTNSYKRLVPGFEAPVNVTYSSRNRTATIRIPQYSNDPLRKRLEFRCPDSSCNPYLAFAATTMAMIDGIKNQIEPGEPMDKPMETLLPEEQMLIDQVPRDLSDALTALEEDHAYLLQGNVFTEDVIRYWIKYKREMEIGALSTRPHPYEFCMYFDN